MPCYTVSRFLLIPAAPPGSPGARRRGRFCHPAIARTPGGSRPAPFAGVSGTVGWGHFLRPSLGPGREGRCPPFAPPLSLVHGTAEVIPARSDRAAHRGVPGVLGGDETMALTADEA